MFQHYYLISYRVGGAQTTLTCYKRNTTFTKEVLCNLQLFLLAFFCSFAGYAPAVSIRVKIGRENLSAKFNTLCFSYPSSNHSKIMENFLSTVFLSQFNNHTRYFLPSFNPPKGYIFFETSITSKKLPIGKNILNYFTRMRYRMPSLTLYPMELIVNKFFEFVLYCFQAY